MKNRVINIKIMKGWYNIMIEKVINIEILKKMI